MAVYCPITVARFWSKVEVTPGKNQCWEWRSSRYPKGYGRAKVNGKVVRANRIAWEIANGEPLAGRHALHKCDNPACCNPAHIYAGTPSENMIDVQLRGSRATNKLTPDDVRAIKERLAEGEPQPAIAEAYGVKPSAISKISRGAAWGYVD